MDWFPTDWLARPWWLMLLVPAAGGVVLAELSLRAARAGAGRGSASQRIVPNGGLGRAARVATRALIALGATLAAAGLRLPGQSERPACVFTLDVSGSMGDPRVARDVYFSAREVLPAGTPRAAVAFGAEARAVLGFADPDDALDLSAAAGVLGTGGTDVAAGLRLALAMLPGDAPGVIVLVSDGRATAGDALAAALECRARGVPVFALGSGPAGADWRLDLLSAPAAAEAGRPVPLAAVVSSGEGGEVVVAVRRRPGGEEVARATVAVVGGGVARAVFQDTPDAGGLVTYEAEVIPPEGRGDVFPENNRAEAAVLIRAKPRVLVVSRGGAVEGLMRRAIADRFEVDARPPRDMPGSWEGLLGFDVVVLEGIARRDVTPAAEEALARYAERGGALLATGGPAAFGAGGWRDGERLPDALPVSMKPPALEEMLVVVLLDASGSMLMKADASGRSKIDLAKEAVAAILAPPLLEPDDRVAVVAFRAVGEIALRPTPLSRRDEIRESIRPIRAEGKTSLAGAFERGLEIMRESTAKRKVAVMLSDGEPTVENNPALMLALAARFKGEGTALHILGTNPSPVHVELLRSLATAGGGTFEFESDYARVLEAVNGLFSKAIKEYVREGPTVVARAAPSDVLAGIESFPAVAGFNRTRLRPGARALLVAASGEPLLATGGAGPGRVAVFASTFGEPWGGELARWPGRFQFLTQILREIAPPPPDAGVRLHALAADVSVFVEVEAADADGAPRNLLDLTVELWPPEGGLGVAGRPVNVPARQVGLGRYRAEVPLSVAGTGSASGVQLARVLSAGGRELARAPVTLPRRAELLRTGADVSSLSAMAEASGGRMLAGPGKVASVLAAARVPRWRDGSGMLAAAVLALVIVELLLRVLVRPSAPATRKDAAA